MKIPFLDLKEINKPYFSALESVSTVIQSGWYIMGQEVESFENAYATYCESDYCIGVSNGLDAIILLLEACNFPKGSEILVPSNTYIATILGILRAGHVPVLVEPNEETYLIELANLEEKISKQTKAVFFVELYGQTGNLAPMSEFCRQHNLKFFCDAAQSHGVRYQNQRSTRWYDGVAHSFYPTKNLGALGDAGAVTTQDSDLAQKVRTLRNYGSSQKYVFDSIGLNARLDELQAHILLKKLPFLDQENEIRKEIAKRYLLEIKNPSIILPKLLQDSVWHLFVIRTQDRAGLQQYLLNLGIGTDIHYPIPPHQQKATQSWLSGQYPISEKLHQHVLSIPLHPRLETTQVDYIIDSLNEWKKN